MKYFHVIRLTLSLWMDEIVSKEESPTGKTIRVDFKTAFSVAKTIWL